MKLPPRGRLRVSVVLSIHNRVKLFRRAIDGYMAQTSPPEEWEIVLVDDMSTEDVSQAYRHLLGRINLRHVKIDHTRHYLFREMNPDWPGKPAENWFHTPAISTNVGISLARGPVLCICHPEILHAPTNFEGACDHLEKMEPSVYVFGPFWMGTQETNRILDGIPDWTKLGWPEFLNAVKSKTLARVVDPYWYVSFLPTEAARFVGGVDLDYLRGAAAEDDDFRDRVHRAGWAPHVHNCVEGIHQDHSDEKEAHRDRGGVRWQKGLATNREFYSRKRKDGMPYPANAGHDWTAKECIVSMTSYRIGRVEPEASKW
jgi:glycosyltransferase involved in cell wall biosynthesis